MLLGALNPAKSGPEKAGHYPADGGSLLMR